MIKVCLVASSGSKCGEYGFSEPDGFATGIKFRSLQRKVNAVRRHNSTALYLKGYPQSPLPFFLFLLLLFSLGFKLFLLFFSLSGFTSQHFDGRILRIDTKATITRIEGLFRPI